jgi:hypothetical protein
MRASPAQDLQAKREDHIAASSNWGIKSDDFTGIAGIMLPMRLRASRFRSRQNGSIVER